MKYTAKLYAQGDPEKMFECIKPEQMSYERSGFTIKKVKDGLEFDIKSKDATALRATLNTISQLLIIFEKGKNPETK